MNNTEPTQEQLKKFWVWCVFKYRKDMSYSDRLVWVRVWEYPDTTLLDTLPKPTLDNLFRYAVPKLTDIRMHRLVYVNGEVAYTFEVNYQSEWSIANDEKPELALFWAIWEVIK